MSSQLTMKTTRKKAANVTVGKSTAESVLEESSCWLRMSNSTAGGASVLPDAPRAPSVPAGRAPNAPRAHALLLIRPGNALR